MQDGSPCSMMTRTSLAKRTLHRCWVQQKYLDRPCVQVWIVQLQVPTDDSCHVQYNYMPQFDGTACAYSRSKYCATPRCLVHSYAVKTDTAPAWQPLELACPTMIQMPHSSASTWPTRPMSSRNAAFATRSAVPVMLVIGAGLVFILDVKSGDEAGQRLQGSETPRQHQTFLLLRLDILIESQIRGSSREATD